jgi:hypothetical protein
MKCPVEYFDLIEVTGGQMRQYSEQFHILYSSLNVTRIITSRVLRGGGFEYLHRSPASRKRRRKGISVPGGITGSPCHWGT